MPRYISPLQHALYRGQTSMARAVTSLSDNGSQDFIDLNHITVQYAIHGCHAIRSHQPLLAICETIFPVQADFASLSKDIEKQHSDHPQDYLDSMLHVLHNADRYWAKHCVEASVRFREALVDDQEQPIMIEPLCRIILKYATLQSLDANDRPALPPAAGLLLSFLLFFF